MVIGLFLFITAAFNYHIDSVGIFHEGKISSIAKELSQGRMLAGEGLQNIDDRLLQQLIIENRKGKVDVIAIGSSRTMLLRSSFLPLRKGETFFNHSMIKCNLGDYIAIVGIYKTRGYIPPIVILGLDPWIFNKGINTGVLRPHTFGAYYDLMMKEIGGTCKTGNAVSIRKSRFLQLINLDFTLSNLKSLSINKSKNYYRTSTVDIDDFIIEPDGSRSYPDMIRYIKDDDVRKGITISGAAHRLEHFEKLSHTVLFQKFIDYLQKNNVKVIFFLPPYHPDAYRLLMAHPEYRNIETVESWLRDFAARKNILILGSYNPAAYGFRSEDFWDAVHAKEQAPRRIFEGIKW